LKDATVTVNVKSLTGYKDKIKEIVEDEETGEKKEVEKENKPEQVTLKVVVDGDTVENSKVKENVTDKTIKNISGTGTVQIKVYIDDTLKKTVNMDLNKTTTMVIE